MSEQIVIDFSEDQVAFIDEQVESGEASGRADVVKKALDREQRRRAAMRDVEIFRLTGPDPYPELNEWVASASRPPMDDLD